MPPKVPPKKKSKKNVKQAKTALTDKHRLFASYFALTNDAKNSAIKAGFSKSTAEKIAFKWIGANRLESFYPELWDMVEDIKATVIKPKLENEFNVTANDVLMELKRIGFSSVKNLFNENDDLINIKDLPDDVAACISSVEVEALYEYVEGYKIQIGHTKKVKLWDKKGSLEMLGKYLGLWKDNAALQLPPNVTLTVKSNGEAPVIADGN